MINLLCLSRLEPLFWVEAQTIPLCRTLHTPFERSARAVSRDPPATPSRHPHFTGSGTRALPAASGTSTPKIFAIETRQPNVASLRVIPSSRSPLSTVRPSRPLRYRPICLLRCHIRTCFLFSPTPRLAWPRRVSYIERASLRGLREYVSVAMVESGHAWKQVRRRRRPCTTATGACRHLGSTITPVLQTLVARLR
ncbi:hypothetical protein GY45DRAFT_485053 [Cubamyces sp. BRFM 1775]|nr:hypothetical protein GY45DRAFT_485053 [Cubamyces sp. BRFM 1775]